MTTKIPSLLRAAVTPFCLILTTSSPSTTSRSKYLLYSPAMYFRLSSASYGSTSMSLDSISLSLDSICSRFLSVFPSFSVQAQATMCSSKGIELKRGSDMDMISRSSVSLFSSGESGRLGTFLRQTATSESKTM